MAENYKPKKMVAVYELPAQEMKCPRCHRVMGSGPRAGEAIFWCFNSECGLFDQRYKVVKTLATIERVDG